MKSKQIRSFLTGVLVAVLVLGLSFSALAAYQKQATLDYTGIKITLDGQAVTPTNALGAPVEPFAIEGTTYLPVRAIANALGLGVEWDQATQTVKLTSPTPAPAVPTTSAGTYSRLAPAPIGTAQSIQIESYSGDYNASVAVVEAIRGDVAWHLLQETNMFNDAPDAGKEYVLAKLRVTINSTEKDAAVSLSKFSFTPYSGDNVEYEQVTVVTPDPYFDGKVFAGGTLEGYAVFLVNQNDPAPKLVFGEKYDGSGGIWFSLV